MHPNWITPFLAALGRGSSVVEASAAAGISSTTAYKLRKEDADFAEAWRIALEDSADVLETEARRRAVDGVEEPVVYQGQLTPVWERDEDGRLVQDIVECEPYKVGDRVFTTQRQPRQARNADGSLKWLTVRKPSDSLLALLLKGRRKDVFADRTELTGANGAPVEIDATTRRARIAAILAKAAQRKTFEDIA
jgi:hypothetical protein